jgi:CDGSH-type Zn-finger protein/uncharacterized Fe-S cluster protein YjdI
MKTKPHRYEGEQVTVTYDQARCIHAGECVKGLPQVFDPSKSPWVSPDAADAAALLEVVSRCPTGALHVEVEDASLRETAPDHNVAVVGADGPLFLRGEVEVLAADGSLLATDTRLALCRCGKSKNKPFCDDSHYEAGFRDPGIPGKFGGLAAEGSGPLRITVLANGPLRAEGPLEVKGPGGETVSCGKVSLCRCGESKNKPFCDGSHRAVGFQA